MFLLLGSKNFCTVFFSTASAVFMKIFGKLFIVAVANHFRNLIMAQAWVLQQFPCLFNANAVQCFLKCKASFLFENFAEIIR